MFKQIDFTEKKSNI